MALAKVAQLSGSLWVPVQVARATLIIVAEGPKNDIASGPVHRRFSIKTMPEADCMADLVGHDALDIAFTYIWVGAPLEVFFVQ